MACCHPPLHKIFEIFSAPLYVLFLQHETQLKKLSSGSEVNKLSITFRALQRKTNKCGNEGTMESLKCTQFPLTNQLIDTNWLLQFTLKDDCKSFWQLNELGWAFYTKMTRFRTVSSLWVRQVSSASFEWAIDWPLQSHLGKAQSHCLPVCFALVADFSFPPLQDPQITTYWLKHHKNKT